MHRQLLGQQLEVLGARDEIGLAVHLDDDADLATQVDVVADHAVLGGAARTLGGGGKALLAKQIDSLVHVAAGLGQRRLAIHHARAGLLAQLLHLISGNCHLELRV